MAPAVDLDASPLNLLRSMRGEIVDARPAYPEVLHVDIRDSAGDLWLFSTQYADWRPTDPNELIGRSVEDIRIDQQTGALSCPLSDGASFEVIPGPFEEADDPCYWELITPGGLFLEFGPGVRWEVRDANSRPIGLAES
jgi:hypothetical protein